MSFTVARWPDPELPGELTPLLAEARDAGVEWMSSFTPEWMERAFLDPGEGLFLARRGSRLLAMAVVSRDGLVGDPDTGRLRYIFVSAAARREGIADALVRACIATADTRWRRLTLHTDNPAAAALYLRHGFIATGEVPRITHQRFNLAPTKTAP